MYWFWCPGCDEAHAYAVAIEGVKPPDKTPMWTFNDNMDVPTFTPSLRIIHETRPCHLIMKDGKIHFCADCFHELAGKVVDLAPIPSWL